MMAEKMPKSFSDFWYKKKPYPIKQNNDTKETNQYSEEWKQFLASVERAIDSNNK